jgi:large subunit ribosomal protein L23
MAKELYGVLRRPVVTEKFTAIGEKQNLVVFEVARDANKLAIREAVEKLFDVKVEEVRTMIVHGKPKRVGRHMGRKPNWKKAVVRLREGDTIDFFATA